MFKAWDIENQVFRLYSCILGCISLSRNMSFQQFTIATLCKGLLYGSYMRRPLAPSGGCILDVHHVCSAATPLFWDFDPCDANRAEYLTLTMANLGC